MLGVRTRMAQKYATAEDNSYTSQDLSKSEVSLWI